MAKKDKEQAPEPRVVAAAAQFSGHGGIATDPLSAEIEAAMSAAVLQALADGVSINDSAAILERKQAARRAVKERADALVSQFSKAFPPIDVARP